MTGPGSAGLGGTDPEELRRLVREVIGGLLPPAGPVTETVNLSTDADLATFVARLLDLNDGEREELRSGRKRFRLAAAPSGTGSAGGPAAVPGPVRRVERGAVTEEIVNQAARAGQRLVLGRGAVLTPLAKDRARASGVEICKER